MIACISEVIDNIYRYIKKNILFIKFYGGN